jgi:hypothetical protein
LSIDHQLKLQDEDFGITSPHFNIDFQYQRRGNFVLEIKLQQSKDQILKHLKIVLRPLRQGLSVTVSRIFIFDREWLVQKNIIAQSIEKKEVKEDPQR